MAATSCLCPERLRNLPTFNMIIICSLYKQESGAYLIQSRFVMCRQRKGEREVLRKMREAEVRELRGSTGM